MAKETYTVTVDTEVKKGFRELCKEQDMNQSKLIEMFMRAYMNGHIELAIVNNKAETRIKE